MTKKEFILKAKKIFLPEQWVGSDRVELITGIIVSPRKCKCDYPQCEGWKWDNSEEEKGFVNFSFFLDELSICASKKTDPIQVYARNFEGREAE